jgi:hypothetical protein
MIIKTTAKISPTTNRIHAILAAVPAIPVKPRTPAMSAIIRNVTAQFIIINLLYYVSKVNEKHYAPFIIVYTPYECLWT